MPKTTAPNEGSEETFPSLPRQRRLLRSGAARAQSDASP